MDFLSNPKFLLAYSGALTLAVVGLALTMYTTPSPVSASSTDKDGVLHVRGLIVEDASGHERVRLGAPLPNPLIHGVRVERRGVISGLLITDATGTERGGYVTEDQGEAFLTLDSQHGQEMTLLSNPGGGINFDISDVKGNEAELTVFPEGPKFVMKKSNQVVLELPVANGTGTK